MWQGLFAVAVHLQSRPNPNRLPIDLLLLLGVGAVGACGSIISFNVLFGCSAQSDVGRASSTWTFPFNASRGSADVLAWAALDRYSSGQRASFAYEPTSSSLFFAGRFGDDTETLWLKRADDPLPVQMDGNLTAPQSLVAVGRHVCFSAFDLRRGYARKVYCCVADGSACAAISIEASLVSERGVERDECASWYDALRRYDPAAAAAAPSLCARSSLACSLMLNAAQMTRAC
jgi:hypothetical protein